VRILFEIAHQLSILGLHLSELFLYYELLVLEIDPKTHHAVRDVYVADLQDKEFVIKEKFTQVQPEDTQLVCDLEKNPNSNKHYEISLN
ncbi:MAG: hypothetical protein AAF493_10315, partial [Pseudomonadota bacterium]